MRGKVKTQEALHSPLQSEGSLMEALKQSVQRVVTSPSAHTLQHLDVLAAGH